MGGVSVGWWKERCVILRAMPDNRGLAGAFRDLQAPTLASLVLCDGCLRDSSRLIGGKPAQGVSAAQGCAV
ncbi:MAG: hypothetical protein ACK41V_18030 [Acidovorax sp.]|uniref:hypothetical protein n=1 Tax=Acidovorax sp. TaxID=1872122 RepID=UPI00391A0F7B